jgi:hypothetical protein
MLRIASVVVSDDEVVILHVTQAIDESAAADRKEAVDQLHSAARALG